MSFPVLSSYGVAKNVMSGLRFPSDMGLQISDSLRFAQELVFCKPKGLQSRALHRRFAYPEGVRRRALQYGGLGRGALSSYLQSTGKGYAGRKGQYVPIISLTGVACTIRAFSRASSLSLAHASLKECDNITPH